MSTKFPDQPSNSFFFFHAGLCAVVLMLKVFLFAEPVRAQRHYVEQLTADGVLKGVLSSDGKVRTFKGVPYAMPPVGALRWKPPQPVASWTGVRRATEFGNRCVQTNVFEDMIFRDPGPSEDCLYLNLWIPASVNLIWPLLIFSFGPTPLVNHLPHPGRSEAQTWVRENF